MDGASAQTQPFSRREFLYYIWGASIAVLLAEWGGALVWFALPRFKPNEFGGIFGVPIDKLPPPGGPPAEYPSGRFWLVHLDQHDVTDPRHPPGYGSQPGVVALYKVCVHLGCLYQWKPTYDRFDCLCHGSKYLKDGTRVHKPASRDLDRLLVRIVDARGNVLAETKSGNANADPTVGQPISVPAGAVALEVETGKRIKGRHNAGRNTVS